MLILGVDPGNEQSAYLAWDTDQQRPLHMGIVKNEELEHFFTTMHPPDTVVIEFPQSYGLAVGRHIFHTCRWVGRFEAALYRAGNRDVRLIGRPSVKGQIGGRTDAEIRASLRLRFGDAKKGERLEGVKKDIWAALAVCVAIHENPNLPRVI